MFSLRGGNRLQFSKNQKGTKATRTARKQQQDEDNQLFKEAEGFLCAPGICD